MICVLILLMLRHLRIPGGTFPEKAGSTGIMPKDRIRSKILNWNKEERSNKEHLPSVVQTELSVPAGTAGSRARTAAEVHQT